MSSPTDLDSVRLLLAEVNSLGSLLLHDAGNETARKGLISAAEKLVIAARTPGENLYMTAAQVDSLPIFQIFHSLTYSSPFLMDQSVLLTLLESLTASQMTQMTA